MLLLTSCRRILRTLLIINVLAIVSEAGGASNWRVIADARPNNAVWMASATEGWAVGNSGLVSRTNDGGRTWTEQASSTTAHLRGIWGVDANNVWAVGDSGVICKYDGNN